jgi:2-oxoglutarate dehydrogenase E2 component (dihydrolipoamide succinyltransferase)
MSISRSRSGPQWPGRAGGARCRRDELCRNRKGIADFGKRAKDGTLTMDDMQGGTFTISNGGVFGGLMSTPDHQPAAVAVLGLHRIEDRPVVRDGQIVVRPMMYLALSYDHRLIDGREAVTA